MRFLRPQRDPKLDRLAGLELFSDCPPRELAQLKNLFEEVDVRPGKLLMTEGRPGWECLVVGHGHATVEIHGEPVGTVGPGAVLGEMALLGDGLRTASVRADDEMHLFVTDRRGFHELMRHPTVAGRISEQSRRRAAGAGTAPGPAAT